MAENNNRSNVDPNQLSEKAKAFQLAMQNALDTGRKGGQTRSDRNAPITRKTLMQHRDQKSEEK